MLNSMNKKELTSIKHTVEGLQKARETEDVQKKHAPSFMLRGCAFWQAGPLYIQRLNACWGRAPTPMNCD